MLQNKSNLLKIEKDPFILLVLVIIVLKLYIYCCLCEYSLYVSFGPLIASLSTRKPFILSAFLQCKVCCFPVTQIVNDVKFTVTQAVEPVEKGFTRFNEKLQKISENIKRKDKDKRRTKDDSCITSPPTQSVIRGIDDPLLNGSISDSGVARGKKHRRKSGYTSAESGGESSSDQSYGGYQIRGRRWLTKD